MRICMHAHTDTEAHTHTHTSVKGHFWQAVVMRSDGKHFTVRVDDGSEDGQVSHTLSS